MKKQKGYSLIEIVVTMGLMVVLFAGFTQILQLYSNSQQNLAYADRKQDIFVSIVNLLNNDIAWQKTIDHPLNLTMNCLKEKAKFPAILNADSCTMADGGKFSLLDETGAIFLNNDVPTAGFSLSSGACNTYAATGDDFCPMRAEVSWKPLCTTCNLNQVEVTIELYDTPQFRKNIQGQVVTRKLVRYAQQFDQDWILFYKFNGAGLTPVGTTITDFSGNKNHGTVSENAAGADPVYIPSASPALGQALLFQPNKYIAAPDTPSLRPGGGITVAAWVRVDVVAFAAIVDKRHTNDLDSFVLRSNGVGNFDFCAAEQAPSRCVTAVPGYALGTWYHVVGVWDTVDIRIYVDGVLRGGPLAYTGPNFWGSFPVLIGAEDQAGFLQFFGGAIDQVKIWKRALKPIEITREFNNP